MTIHCMLNHTDWAGWYSGSTADFCGRCLVEIPSKTPAVLTKFLLIFLSLSSHTLGKWHNWIMMVCSYFICCRFHWCGSRVWKARNTRSCGENCGLHSWREHAASGGAAGGTRECCHLRLTDWGLQRVWSPCTLNLSPDIPILRSQLWVDDPGFNSQHRQETSPFSKMSKLASGRTWPPIHWVPGVKQPDQKVDNSPLSSTKVKIEWIYTSTISVCIH